MTTIYEKRVPPGQEFVFADGTKIWNIQELGEKISIIDDAEFHRYVNEEKNDFVNWLVYSLQNEELANIIAEIRSRPLMYLKIRQYILKNKGTTTAQASVEKPKRTGLFSMPQKASAPEPTEQEEQKTTQIQPEQKEQVTAPQVQKPEEAKPNFIERLRQSTPPPTQQQQITRPQEVEVQKHKDEEEVATEFVVKEFIYGVVCGILIGLIIAKIIEILFP